MKNKGLYIALALIFLSLLITELWKAVDGGSPVEFGWLLGLATGLLSGTIIMVTD